MNFLIIILILFILIIASYFSHSEWQERKRCPNCNSLDTEQLSKIDSRDVLLQENTVVYIYECNNCCNKFSKIDYENKSSD